MSDLPGVNVSGTDLAGVGQEIQALESGQAAAPAPLPRRGRPPGSKTKNRALIQTAPPGPTPFDAAADAERRRRQEESAERTAETRATLPLKAAGWLYAAQTGYRGDAFKLTPEETRQLAGAQRDGMRAVAAMQDGIGKRILAVVIGSDDLPDGVLLCALGIVALQAEVIHRRVMLAEAEKGKTASGK